MTPKDFSHVAPAVIIGHVLSDRWGIEKPFHHDAPRAQQGNSLSQRFFAVGSQS